MNTADIKERRESLGVTQAELAKAAYVFQSYVSRFESGRVDPHMSTFIRLMGALDKIEENQDKNINETEE